MMLMLHQLQNLFRVVTTFALTLTKDLSVTLVPLANMLFSMEMKVPLVDT